MALNKVSLSLVKKPEPCGSPLFEPCNLDWETYLPFGNRNVLPKGSIVYHSNDKVDCLYYLKSGLLKQSFISSNGVEKVVGIIKAGNFFGEAIFFHGFPAICGSTAIKDSVVYSFTREKVEYMVTTNPIILSHFVRSMSLKIRMLATQIDLVSSPDAQTKVCKILYLLVQQHPNDQIKLEMSHQEIAELAGVHRVTVSRTIAELRRQGVLDYHRGYMSLRDRTVLARFAAIQK